MLDLSIARLRQILANISQRKRNELEQKAFFIEWQTKTLAGFVAATVGKEGKGLQKEASKINLLKLLRDAFSEDGSTDLDSMREADTEPGSTEAPGAAVDAELPAWVREGSAVALSRNRAGTAEALMGGIR